MVATKALNIHPDGIARHALILPQNGRWEIAILRRMLPKPLLPRMRKSIRSKHPREEIGNVAFNLPMNPA
jgi:hypothetical protein